MRPFDAGSLNSIRAAHAGKSFVLAFWSVTCEPCRGEMKLWKSFRRKYPGVPVVLVSTDLPGERSAIADFLARYDPGPVEHWAYADEFTERIRYAVDPGWRGELPRTYFFNAAHERDAHSGRLDPRQTERWFSRQAAVQRK
jgi:hypothetical protein